jgi:hypothetical protein
LSLIAGSIGEDDIRDVRKDMEEALAFIIPSISEDEFFSQ